jgi:hypothetical protein
MKAKWNHLLVMAVVMVMALSNVPSRPAVAAEAKKAAPDATMVSRDRGDVSFAKETVGSIPNGWQIAETNGKGAAAKWEIIADPSAPNGPNVVAITANANTGQTFSLLIKKQPILKDVFVSASVKAMGGKEDQGGGPVWRCKDANNYYVARWNPLETNLRLYCVKDGKRVQLATVEKIAADPKAWHRISVSHVGDNIVVWFDGKEITKAKDSTLTDAGTVGLWVKADGRSEFAKFRVRVPFATQPAKSTAAAALKDNPMTLSELPPAVKATLDAASKGGAIAEIVKVTKGEKVVRYEIDVTVDGKTQEIQIGPSGKLLRGLPGAGAKEKTPTTKSEWLKEFKESPTQLAGAGKSTYFILEPGYVLKYRSANGAELMITVLDETKVINGVETRVVEERETKDGQLAEVSLNWFAISKATGNVYYFGEDSREYKDGKVVSQAGSWEAGKDDAKFGAMMYGKPEVGQKYYQEMAPKTAMDRAENVSLSETMKVPAGEFENCLKVEESSALESGKGYKYYAPGVGLIKDEDFVLVSYGYEKQKGEKDEQSKAEKSKGRKERKVKKAE